MNNENINKGKIYKEFTKTIKKYNLIENNDKLLICISGGKDSYVLAKCIENYVKNKSIKFEYELCMINPGYSEENINIVNKNNKDFTKKVNIINNNILQEINKLKKTSKCFVCSKKRRYELYKEAERLKCNKIVLGHHKDDVIETILLSMLYSGEFKGMIPKTKSESNKIEIIRPLFDVKEEDIKKYIKENKKEFISNCCSNKINDEKRKEVKKIIKYLKTYNNQVEDNIFSSLKNVNLDMIIGTKRRDNNG